jgi:hypothetical protein
MLRYILSKISFCPFAIQKQAGDHIKNNTFSWGVVCIGERKGACTVLVWSSEGKRPLVRPGYRCTDDIKVYIKDMGWEDEDWINLT